MCTPANDLELAKLAVENARHYGTMRFAMFTVFAAVLGALASFGFSESGSRFVAHKGRLLGLSTIGFTLSVLFTLAEYRVSELVVLYQDAAYKAKALPEPPANDFWKRVVVVTMIAPYFFSAVFWVLVGFGVVTFPSWPTS